MKTILIFIICLLPTFSLAQFHSTEPVAPDDISDWEVTDTRDYQGIYHFGFSEEEGELRIFGDSTLWVAQTRSYVYGETTWIDTFRVFTNVQISGVRFRSDQARGRFVEFMWNGKKEKGLWIENPWNYEMFPGGEIGNRAPGTLAGKYPQASTQILTEADLRTYDATSLRIMRNEIFARYGYIFREGGEMDRYFSEQPWYRAAYENVNPFLTPIEEENISRILMVEK